MDVQAEIQQTLNQIDEIDKVLAQRVRDIEKLEQELEEAKIELEEF